MNTMSASDTRIIAGIKSAKSITKSTTFVVSEDELTLENSETNSVSEKEENVRTECEGDRPVSLLTPFILTWGFGLNINAKVLNLTNKLGPQIFYACANSCFLYNYEENTVQILQGHKNPVVSMDNNANGQWVVTSDVGEDSAVFVWDINKRLPVYTLYSCYKNGAVLVGMSLNAKYLVTIGYEDNPVVKFWMWTYGNDTEDGSYTFEDSSFGKPLDIAFNAAMNEHFAVTFENQVAFLVWHKDEKKLTCCVPPIRKPKHFGKLIRTCYAKFCHECFSCTDNGCILVWGVALYTLPLGESKYINEKIFIKSIKLQKDPFTLIKTNEKFLITGDVNGHIKFYDNKMELLYWYDQFELTSIVQISFDKTDKLNYEKFKHKERTEEDTHKITPPSQFYKRHPSIAALSRNPFHAYNFIALTSDGQIIRIDTKTNSAECLNQCYNGSPITAMDVHDEKNLIIIANANTTLKLYDYEKHTMIVSTTLSKLVKKYAHKTDLTVTSIKYSPEGLHLACGLSNGDVWMLEPVLLTLLNVIPFKITKYPIMKIVFSVNSKFFAFFDANMLVAAFRYEHNDENPNGHWAHLGKIRAHYEPIADIIFNTTLPVRLFSIGEDRYIIEYELYGPPGAQMKYTFRDQYDQFAKPICFTNYPKPANSISKDKYFLVADDAFKFKVVTDYNAAIKNIYLGPKYDSPVQKILVRTHEDSDEFKFLIFCTNRHIGIQMLPTDGNPYKYVGMVGHPNSILDIALSGNGKYLFTVGKDDTTVQMWTINTQSSFEMEKIGGSELEPFYPLIEGGKDGYLFKEMQDIFYYIQILYQTENPNLPRAVSDYVPITEITDLVRAVGFYPSQFEIDNLMNDITYRNYDVTLRTETMISFHDFVKLYINHRPPFGISMYQLEKAFNIFVKSESDFRNDVSRDYFIEAMCTMGEPMKPNELFKYLANVFKFDGTWKDDKHMKFLPGTIHFETFVEEILGIDYSANAGGEENTAPLNLFSKFGR